MRLSARQARQKSSSARTQTKESACGVFVRPFGAKEPPASSVNKGEGQQHAQERSVQAP